MIPRPMLPALMMLCVALLLSSSPAFAQAGRLPAPELLEVEVLPNGGLTVGWRVRTAVPLRPQGWWGNRVNVYVEQTNELIYAYSTEGDYSYNYDGRDQGLNVPPAVLRRGSAKETRYCVSVLTYEGDGTNAGSVFSQESRRGCAGPQAAPAPQKPESAPAGPPAPTKPDLQITRVSGPTELQEGVSAVYEIALWNEGAPAPVAPVFIGATGALTLEELVQEPDGFQCEEGELGLNCIGALGGVNDPLIRRGALFRVRVRATELGEGALIGSANHAADPAIIELSTENNLKVIIVKVR